MADSELTTRKSVKEAQNELILVVEQMLDVVALIKCREQDNLPNQPFIVIIGSVLHTETILVAFDDNY